jgi:hypothetical protein
VSKDRRFEDIESERKGRCSDERPCDQSDRQRLRGNACHCEHGDGGDIGA